MPPIFTFPPPEEEEPPDAKSKPPQEEPPQDEKTPSRDLTPLPRESGIGFFVDTNFRFDGIAPAYKHQFPTSFKLSLAVSTVINPASLSIDSVDFGAMDGLDLSIDLHALRLFARYDLGTATGSGFVPAVPGNRGGGLPSSSVDLTWRVTAWELGIERPLLRGRWSDFSFDLSALAAYFAYTFDPSSAVETNAGTSAGLNLGRERFTGFLLGAAARVEARVWKELYLSGAVELLFLTGDLRGEATQLMIGGEWRF